MTCVRCCRLPVAWGAAAVIAFALLVAAAADSGGQPRRMSDGSDEVPTILVSRQLLEAERLSVGDVVQLSADPSGREPRAFRIVGVYEPMADPMRLTSQRMEARLHLQDLLALTADPNDPTDAESVTALNIALADPADATAFAHDLSAKAPDLVVQPTAVTDERAGTFVALERFHLAIAIVTVVGSAMFLLALMVILAEERREMFGTLRLIGLSRRRVLWQVLTEGLLMAVMGALFGVLLAWAVEGPFNRFFQHWYDTSLVFLRVTGEVAWRSVLVAVPLGVLASLAASWVFLRRDLLTWVRR